jgi:hypothetical protein
LNRQTLKRSRSQNRPITACGYAQQFVSRFRQRRCSLTRGLPTRVNLAKWAGVGKRKLNRTEAIAILADVRAAIFSGEFNSKGKAKVGGDRTFGDLLDDFERDYVAKRRADGKLRSSSFDYYIARFRAEFAAENLTLLEQAPRRFETWLD